MSQLSKILVTIGVVVLFVIIFGAIAGSMSDAGRTPGIFGTNCFWCFDRGIEGYLEEA